MKEIKKEKISKFSSKTKINNTFVDEDIEVGQIEKIIARKGKKILEDIKLFDVYRHEKIGKDKKSVAYALTFRSKDRTLTDDEINETMDGIIKELENSLKAELRK